MSDDFYKTYILPYAPIITKICRAYTHTQDDFDDYYQEVCLQIWKSNSQFKKESKWSTWIYRISLNVCLSLDRKEKKRSNEKEKLSAQDFEQNNSFTNDSLNQLYDVIKTLSDLDRAIIILYLEEKNNTEIATVLGISYTNVGVRINRIKEKLRYTVNEKFN